MPLSTRWRRVVGTRTDWLLEREKWPEQPNLQSSSDARQEEKPVREIVSYVVERQQDELDELLLRKTYWTTVRITAWLLRFLYNLRASKGRKRRKRGPLTTDEMSEAQNRWVRREQNYVQRSFEQPGWSLVEDPMQKS